MKRALALIGINVVASWLLPPMFIRPFHPPPPGDYLLVLMLLSAGLLLWPLVVIVLVGAKWMDFVHGRALLDLAGGILLPALIAYATVRVLARRPPARADVVVLHVAIAALFVAAWIGYLTTGLELMAGA